MRKLILAIVVVAAAAAGLYWWWNEQRIRPSTDDAYVGANIVQVAPEIGGRVTKVNVTENQHVKAGDILFEIETDQLKAAVDAARAARDTALQAVLANAANVTVAQAGVAQAEAALTDSQRTYSRTELLFQSNQTPQATLDAALSARDQSIANRNAAQARLRAAQAALGDNGADNSTVRSAQAALDQATIMLSNATVAARASGWIANVSLRPGQVVAAGQPLFALVEDGDWWVDANFKETDLNRIRPQEPAKISIDMYPGLTLNGTVESIGLGSGSAFALLPPQNATGNWVKVTQRFPIRIRIDEIPTDPARQLRVGASATVTVDTSSLGD